MGEKCEIRILSVDDHPLFREGIAAVIKNQRDMLLVAEASNGKEALQGFREHRPDVTLMNLKLPDSSGIEAMVAIRTEFPEARVIVVSTFESTHEIQSALESGAWGYILKTLHPREMVDIIRQVYGGSKYAPPATDADVAEHLGANALTPLEVEVLTSVAGGNRIRDLRNRLFISEDAVKNHMKQIMHTLDAGHRGSAVNLATRRGFIGF